MIMRGLYIIKTAVDYLNRGQLSAIAFDQPLYALAKLMELEKKLQRKVICHHDRSTAH